jgi:hypothetical protein
MSVAANLDHLMKLHSSGMGNSTSLDNINLAFKSIEDALFNLQITNYTSLIILICLIIIL